MKFMTAFSAKVMTVLMMTTGTAPKNRICQSRFRSTNLSQARFQSLNPHQATPLLSLGAIVKLIETRREAWTPEGTTSWGQVLFL